MSRCRSGATVRLLAVLCVTAGCTAAPQPQQEPAESPTETPTAEPTELALPRDCSDLPMKSPSGVYNLSLGRDSRQPPVPAYCDMETAGGNWTVFQRRDLTRDERQSFRQGWKEYKDGFGSLTGEFWWGLQNVRNLTRAKDRRYELRVNLTARDGAERYAIYTYFRLSPEGKGYQLKYRHYQVTAYHPASARAGDGFGDFHRNVKFATHDNDNSGQSCAGGGGWWLPGTTTLPPSICGRTSFLNGPVNTQFPHISAIFWPGALHWDKSAMMIRPDPSFLGATEE